MGALGGGRRPYGGGTPYNKEVDDIVEYKLFPWDTYNSHISIYMYIPPPTLLFTIYYVQKKYIYIYIHTFTYC